MSKSKENIFYITNRISEIFKKYNFSPEDKKATLIFFEKLENYLQFFNKFDTEIKDNKNINKFSKKAFDRHQKEIISEAYFLEKKIKSLILKKEIRELSRHTACEYIFRSSILKRAYEKPRGYPGDCFIFEKFYNHNLTTKGIGRYLDEWILKHELVRGVIYRKNKIKKLLGGLIKNNKNKLNILNIGCGSSREIRELILEKKLNIDNVVFTCLDQDIEALNFSKKSIGKINPNLNITFLKQDILSISLNRVRKQINEQDVIYSIGVADYFLKTTLENFIMFSYNLLKPKGKLIIPLCSSHNSKLYIPLRWFCEWNFYSHNADKIKDFIHNELHIEKVKIIWERQKPIFFVVIEK